MLLSGDLLNFREYILPWGRFTSACEMENKGLDKGLAKKINKNTFPACQNVTNLEWPCTEEGRGKTTLKDRSHLQLQHNGPACTRPCTQRDPYWRNWKGRETHEGIAGNKYSINHYLYQGKKNIIKTPRSHGLQHLQQLNGGAFMKFDSILSYVTIKIRLCSDFGTL